MQEPIFGSGAAERRPSYPRRTAERQFDQGTAMALHTFRVDGMVRRCTYCQDKHDEENCWKVKDLETRKRIVKKFGRCFICIKKGHKVIDCNDM